MPKIKKISGKVAFQSLGTGFWGIIDQHGKEWLPVNMPEQLKVDGAKVNITIREKEDFFSIHMWGTPMEIISFHTL